MVPVKGGFSDVRSYSSVRYVEYYQVSHLIAVQNPPPQFWGSLGTMTMASDGSHSPLWPWYSQPECVGLIYIICAMMPTLGLVEFLQVGVIWYYITLYLL